MVPVAALAGPHPRLAPLSTRRHTNSAPVCDKEYVTNTALTMVTSTRNYYQPLPIMYAICRKIFMEIRMRFKLEVGLRICGGIPKAAVVRSNPFSDESDEPRASPCTGRTAYRKNLRAIATVREYKYTKLESKSDDAKAAPIPTRRHSPDDEFPECRQVRFAQCTTDDVKTERIT